MLGDRIRNLREKRGSTRKDMGELLGIDQTSYGKYELNKRTPDFNTLKKIAEYFKVPVAYLLEEGLYANMDLVEQYYELIPVQIEKDFGEDSPIYQIITSEEFEKFDIIEKLRVLSVFIRRADIDEENKIFKLVYYDNDRVDTDAYFYDEFIKKSPPLDPQETQLITNYRVLDVEGKAEVRGFTKALANAKIKRKE